MPTPLLRMHVMFFCLPKKLCEEKPTKANLKKVNKAQKQLDEAYMNAEAEYIQGKITYISKQHAAKKHAVAWATISELTGRKSTPPDDEIVSSLLMWRPTGTVKSRKLKFPDVIARDTGIATNELGFAMKDREVWRTVVARPTRAKDDDV